jgi:thiol-disulfide isomerase/thioredoxin
MMKRRHFSAAFVASIASVGLIGCRGDSSYSLIGKTLPSIKGVFVDGTGFDLGQISKPAIIRFWGMWCGPCIVDMPNWQALVRKLRAGDKAMPEVNVFTIHVGVAPSNGDTLVQWTSNQASDVATPVVDDSAYAISKAVGITGTPSTLFIDRQGRIAEHAWEFKNQRGVDSFLRKVQ